MLLLRERYRSLLKSIALAVVCLFMFDSSGFAGIRSSATLAAESRFQPFFENHGLSLKKASSIIYAACRIRDLLSQDNIRKGNIIRVNRALFPNGDIEIDHKISRAKFRSTGETYHYATFRVQHGKKIIKAVIKSDHVKFSEKALKELGIGTEEDKRAFNSGKYPALRGVWFQDPPEELRGVVKNTVSAGGEIVTESRTFPPETGAIGFPSAEDRARPVDGTVKRGASLTAEQVSALYDKYKREYPSLFELIKFCAVGFSGVLVDMLVVAGIKEVTGVDVRVAAIGGFGAAVTTNYLFNRYWTFEGGNKTPFLKGYATFLATCCAGLFVRLVVMQALISNFELLNTGKWYLLTNFMGITVGTIINFAGSKYFVFSGRRGALDGNKDSERTADDPSSIQETSPVLGAQADWRDAFKDTSKPLFVENGVGDGRKSLEVARGNPETNFIFTEGEETAFGRLKENAISAGLANVRIVFGKDADLFSVQEGRDFADLIYCVAPFYSTPWPYFFSRGQEDPVFQKAYGLLKEGGEIVVVPDETMAGEWYPHFTENFPGASISAKSRVFPNLVDLLLDFHRYSLDYNYADPVVIEKPELGEPEPAVPGSPADVSDIAGNAEEERSSMKTAVKPGREDGSGQADRDAQGFIAQAGRGHNANLDLTPLIPDKTIIFHVIAETIIPEGQRNMMKRLEQRMRGGKYLEKIVILSASDRDDPATFMKALEALKAREEKRHKDHKIEFNVACHKNEKGIVGMVQEAGMRALAFERGSGGDIVQIESVMLALRALRTGETAELIRAYKFITGKEPEVSTGDIDQLARTLSFVLPARRIKIDDIGTINRIIEDNILAAA
jgi:putative flippase GtrA/tRNA G46 methylase TrmB